MTNLSKERLEEILAATEGVTPGPWYQSGPPWFHDRGLVLAYTPDGNIAPTVADCEPNFAERDEWNESNPDRQLSLADVDAAHIKNCDPDTIRSMASELLRLRGERDELYVALGAWHLRDQRRTESQIAELERLKKFTEANLGRQHEKLYDIPAVLGRIIESARAARNGGSE